MQFGAYRVGITGGIGSGKSTVTTQLKSLGAGVIDADAISRHLTSSHGEAMNAIVEKFGDEYQLADGSLDRSRMRELVFNQKDRRKELEQILHPLIQNEMKNQFETNPPVDHASDSATLRSYLEKILPSFDHEKVQISDIKKLIKWFHLLDPLAVLVKEEESETEKKPIEAAVEESIAEMSEEAKPTKKKGKN